MMNFGRTLLVLIFLTGPLFFFFLLVPGFGHGEIEQAEMVVRIQAALHATAQVAGVLLALVAATALARGAWQGRELQNLVTCGVALLGGILLFELHWSVVVIFGLLVLAHVGRGLLERRWGPAPDQGEGTERRPPSPGTGAEAAPPPA